MLRRRGESAGLGYALLRLFNVRIKRSKECSRCWMTSSGKALVPHRDHDKASKRSSGSAQGAAVKAKSQPPDPKLRTTAFHRGVVSHEPSEPPPDVAPP
jgi:hypothetical protein